MELSMKETSVTIIFMVINNININDYKQEMENIYGVMVGGIMDNGNRIRWMERENSLGLMERNIQVLSIINIIKQGIMWKIRRKAMESSIGRMVRFIREVGWMESRMVLELSQIKMEMRLRLNGQMVKKYKFSDLLLLQINNNKYKYIYFKSVFEYLNFYVIKVLPQSSI